MENNQATPTILQEVREKIFSLYWGQEVLQHGTYDFVKIIPAVLLHYNVQHWHLILKHISAITDLELKQLCHINNTVSTVFNGEIILQNYRKGYFTIPTIDFLRSNGLALPAFGYSVDDLVNAGVFRLKEVEQ